MKNFTYYSPTKVIFGKDTELLTGQEIKNFGGTKVLVVYGSGSVVKSGLLDRVTKTLKDANLAYTSIGGVQPNPKLSLAEAGKKLALDFGADFILAVGGGSSIDTAKAIAVGLADASIPIWNYWSGKNEILKAIPMACVLTISAAGSETSSSSVITEDETKTKIGIGSDFMRPKFAILNPELTYSLPSYQISCGIADIMMHTLDRYFTLTEGNQITDEIAEAVLRTVIENGPKAIKNPNDYDSMSELMWCGSISHDDLTGLGAVTDFAPHQLGHELSGMFDVAHGASLSTVWGSWALYCYKEKVKRFVRFASKVWGINEGSDEQIALAGIDKTVEFFKSINMPTCFTELGIGVQSEETLMELADRCVFHGNRTIGSFKVLDKDGSFDIYKLANR